ncbi:hypothetical protein N7493_000783 [Penicillium malachiteum]|uniref:Uncharacterized protein n=1 Tax=Penicillium malachiteum TaxID=1324776 RepID=A0AAD6HWZ7_9EURO|nr:hypothetical protein N7493_000783 [Penicillium malachiteum]
MWSLSSSSQGSRKSTRLVNRIEQANQQEKELPQTVGEIDTGEPERASSAPVDHESDSDFRLSPRKAPGKYTYTDIDSSAGYTLYHQTHHSTHTAPTS